jgi:ABC-type branched-subunit amino acid transport system ATPase component
MSLLEVDKINTLYGDSHVLFDLSLRVEEGEVVALLGRNGAGTTTTLRSIMGVLAPRSGEIRLDGASPSQALRRRPSPAWACSWCRKSAPSSAASPSRRTSRSPR